MISSQKVLGWRSDYGATARGGTLDILYVHPAKQEVDARYDKFISCSPYPFIPVGVPALVNMLRGDGWTVEGLNLPVELLLQATFDFRGWLRSQSQRPHLVLVDLHWYEHSYGAIEVARAVKAVWPQVPVTLGGLTATRFASEILEQFPEVDYVVCGDAEVPLELLARRCCGDGQVDLSSIPNLVYRERGEVRRNVLSYTASGADLDRLDFVSMDWLRHWQNYGAFQYSGAGEVRLHAGRFQGHWLAVGRGCTFDCIYCGGCRDAHRALAGREGLVLRSPDRVVMDIQRLQDRGVHQVALSLDLAVLEPAWWRMFFRLLQEQDLRVGLYNEFFQLPSVEFIEEFAKVADLEHTEVAISPLSGDQRVRQRNGKFYSNERLLRTLEVFKCCEIPIFVYFSLNLAGETPQAFRRTLRLAEQIGRFYPPELLRMLNTCHTLDPLSPMSLGGQASKKLGIRVYYRTFQDYYTYCRGTGWQPRLVTRGQHRGFEMVGRPAEVVEKMARQWDSFAEKQRCRCYPVPRGW